MYVLNFLRKNLFENALTRYFCLLLPTCLTLKFGPTPVSSDSLSVSWQFLDPFSCQFPSFSIFCHSHIPFFLSAPSRLPSCQFPCLSCQISSPIPLYSAFPPLVNSHICALLSDPVSSPVRSRLLSCQIPSPLLSDPVYSPVRSRLPSCRIMPPLLSDPVSFLSDPIRPPVRFHHRCGSLIWPPE